VVTTCSTSLGINNSELWLKNYVLCNSQNKQRLFPYTILISFLSNRIKVLCDVENQFQSTCWLKFILRKDSQSRLISLVEVLWYLSVIGFNLLPSLASNHIILLSSEACICPLGRALPAVWPQCTCYGCHVSALIILNRSAHQWNTKVSRTLLTCQPMDRTVTIGLCGVIYRHNSENISLAKTKHRGKAQNY
jgi:hypothetical protein